MNKDMCIACDEGILNIRVGAIIMKEGKLLMVGNDRADYLYSVGSRIKFGETAEEAVVREVLEETGVKMKIERRKYNFSKAVKPYERTTGKKLYPEYRTVIRRYCISSRLPGSQFLFPGIFSLARKYGYRI